MWIFGLIAVYMIGVNHGLTRGFRLNTSSVDSYKKTFEEGFDCGKSSMMGWKTEAESNRKKIDQLNRFIVRELKVKKK
jgi:hypothetical protein